MQNLLNDSEHIAFLAHCEKNIHFKTNQVLARFFENPLHVSAFMAYVRAPIEKNFLFVSNLFREHFFNIRFVKYLSSLISFATIDYHRSYGKHLLRNQLIFDVPAGNEGDMSLGEFVSLQQQPPDNMSFILTPEQFCESIEHNALFKAFSTISDRQKEVITLVYAVGLLDSEIAHIFGVSQQAITKSRISALRKMRTHIS
ncbi:sigma factor-like helix-turn-helix DNA-binding protein [Paenibacillus sp. FSL R7-0026]|uniref:sigma factor-like helix-turn-helix DNA-binding protein n=1 Tax=Paenibacillus sp. FSL R7-0026 TaxID=2921668 RepID=UPI0030F71B0C